MLKSVKLFGLLVGITLLIGAIGACNNEQTTETQPIDMGEDMAKGGKIEITAPAHGAQVEAGKPVSLKYDVTLSEKGDHIHIAVDDGEPAVIRELQGTYETKPLSPGEHTITIQEVTSGHSPTGKEASIQVTAAEAQAAQEGQG